MYAAFLGDVNVNVGCGGNPVDGFLNFDKKEWHLGEMPLGNLPVERNSVDCITALHVMEHVPNIIHAMREIHWVLKPGGYFVAITPHASSDAAWEDPTHVRFFTEGSWSYFDRELYQRPDHPGHYDSEVDYSFSIHHLSLIPHEGFATDPDINFKAKHYRNVISELHAVLRKA